MKANEAKLIRIIEGTNQYLVPHFQRPYTWQKKNWDALWSDLESLLPPADLDDSSHDVLAQDHFMGAIVTAPAHSVPEGVTKYLLIDGQQRLTTLFLLLAAIRDRATQVDEQKLASKIHDLYLTNRYQEGLDQYKLLPTQGDEPSHNDRSAFVAVIDKTEQAPARGNLALAHQHFGRLLKDYGPEQLGALTNAIVGHVALVSIVLERDDNPYAIFESLNAKGQPLSQADLVRNFFFMSIDSSRHEAVYSEKWVPMERRIGRENMEGYLRHFLIKRRGVLIKEADVYFSLKVDVEAAGRDSAEPMLDEIVRLSHFYILFINPDCENSQLVRERLTRLQRLRATVCYPFLLSVFEDRSRGNVSDVQVAEILDTIENFIVRRYVCGTMRAELNELFTALYRNASRFSSLVTGVKEVLASRNYPLDSEFSDSLQNRKLYRAGEARDRAKLILERLEASWSSKERIDFSGLSIEHIMPQTLTEWWRSHIGADAEETYELYVHTLGNLTLTGYNPELSNSEFDKKKALLLESKLAMNREVAGRDAWRKEEIEARAESLACRAIEVWPSFAPNAGSRAVVSVTGKTPTSLSVLGQQFGVHTWQDVLRLTLDNVCTLGSDVIEQVAEELPRYVATEDGGMRTPRKLENGMCYESHLNATQIHKICSQVAQIAGLSSEEWHVTMR